MCATPKTILRSEIDDGMRQVMGEQASVCRPAKGEPTTTRTGAHPLVVYQPRGTTRAERTKNEQKRRRASVAGTLGSKRTKIAARGNFTSTNRVGDRGSGNTRGHSIASIARPLSPSAIVGVAMLVQGFGLKGVCSKNNEQCGLRVPNFSRSSNCALCTALAIQITPVINPHHLQLTERCAVFPATILQANPTIQVSGTQGDLRRDFAETVLG